MRFSFFFLLTLVTIVSVCADDSSVVSQNGDWQADSPDQKLFAALAVEPWEQMIWRKDYGTGLLEVVNITPAGGGYSAGLPVPGYGQYKCFKLPARTGLKAQWSPDSRYLVVTTASLDGHSPWQIETLVYCADDKTLRLANKVVGLVISPDFKFIGPHTVELKIGAVNDSGIDFQHPKITDVDLNVKSQSMENQESFIKGDLSVPSGDN